jgi:hypothetical protein
MRKHGFYSRTVVTGEDCHSILIRRLLCVLTGRTVSLLPDFLVPRKQHSCAVIAAFFHAWAVLDVTLTAAMARATSVAPMRQKAQFWIRGFAKNLSKIRAYLAEIDPGQTILAPKRRVTRSLPRDFIAPVFSHMLKDYRTPQSAFEHMLKDYRTPQSAFEFHSRGFHVRFHQPLI